MRKETDLRQVKATARALLMLDIGETDFSPMIVKHPFTDSGITAIPKPDGRIQMLNLMDDPTDQKRLGILQIYAYYTITEVKQ